MKPVIAQSVYKTLRHISHPLKPYLSENLSGAKIVNDQHLDDKIISLNSIVEFRYEPGSPPIRIQIVLPENEDYGKRKISVLAPICRALLGYKEFDTISAKMPSGEKRIKVLSVRN
jgi:regulator of nucleoside diphosphate kinase